MSVQRIIHSLNKHKNVYVLAENSDEISSKIFIFAITLACVVFDQNHKETTAYNVLFVQDECNGTRIALGTMSASDPV